MSYDVCRVNLLFIFLNKPVSAISGTSRSHTKAHIDLYCFQLQAPNLDAIVIPKVNSAADLTFVTDVLRHVQPHRHPLTTSTAPSSQTPIKLIALVESAKSIMNLESICKASPYLDGLIFAAEDFALDLSLTRTPSLSEFLYARSAIVTAARANNLPSAIDLVCTQFRGEEGMKTLREEAESGKRMGFNGKQCIHPTQVEVSHEVFAPSKSELEWAVRITIADEIAIQQGKGSWGLDGKMIDAPVVGKARGLVKRAEACEMQNILEELRTTHKDAKPE